MQKSSELSPAERLAEFKQTMGPRPTVLRGDAAISAASALFHGAPLEFVVAMGGYGVTDKAGRLLDRGERFMVDPVDFPKYTKSVSLGRVLPGVLWDAVQLYDQQKHVWEALSPLAEGYYKSLQSVSQSENLLIAARAAYDAAVARLDQAKSAVLAREAEFTRALDQAGL